MAIHSLIDKGFILELEDTRFLYHRDYGRHKFLGPSVIPCKDTSWPKVSPNELTFWKD